MAGSTMSSIVSIIFAAGLVSSLVTVSTFSFSTTSIDEASIMISFASS